jgi:uncharacterized OB-fold protein
MTSTTRIPVVEGVFAETADGPRLVGSRCTACHTPHFPRSPVCRNPSCGSQDVADAEFGPAGTLWSFTIQHYKPPPPMRFDDPFLPYGIGLVDLPGGLRVLSMMSASDPERLKIGMDVELVIEALYHDDGGNEVVTWKFRPAPTEPRG